MTKIALLNAATALSIVAHQDERWRAGRKFTREATVVPIDELDEEQIEALYGDPLLSVTETEIEPDAEVIAAAQANAEKAEAEAKAKADAEKAEAEAKAKADAEKAAAKK